MCFIVPISCLVLVLGGCAASKENQAAAAALQGQVVEDTHRLRPGDVLDINVFQEPQMSTKQRVLNDGTISIGYLGRVKVADETVAEASNKLEHMLDGKYLTNPQVSLIVTTYASRKFTVLGKVNSAGIFDIPPEGSTSLPEAVAMAGGNSETGDLKRVLIFRKTPAGTVEKLRVNVLDAKAPLFQINEGDVILVPETVF